MGVPELTSLSPREWLEYQRRLHGYSDAPISSSLINEAFEDMPPEAGPLRHLYMQMSKGALDDRWVQIFWQPLVKLWKPEEWAQLKAVYFGIFPTFEVNG